MGEGNLQSKTALPRPRLLAFLAPLKKLMQEDSGQATVEYILLLAGVVAATTLMFKGIAGALDNGANSLGTQLENNLHTGRLPASIWAN
jgi:Flp pilus assembly pilin Flp